MNCRLQPALTVVAILCALSPTAAQQRLGSEFQVNTTKYHRQEGADVAGDVGGSFVVVWSDAGVGRVFGQRFDVYGNPTGGESQIGSNTASGQGSPAVALDAQGNFVVVWRGTPRTIVGQLYDSLGGPVGSEFQVSTGSAFPHHPEIAADSAGNFVVVWKEFGIKGRRFDSSANALGEEFQISDPVLLESSYWASVGLDEAGNFVVAWQRGYKGYLYQQYFNVFARRFDSSGNRVGDEFQVNAYTTGFQGEPEVAVGPGGDFIVVWASGTKNLYLGISERNVVAQRYDSLGDPIGGEFAVSSFSHEDNAHPRIAVDDGGAFVAIWQSGRSWPSFRRYYDVAGLQFDATGNAIGAEFQINTYTTGVQEWPILAMTGDERFVVVWQDEGQPAPILSPDLFGQRFAMSGLQLTVDGRCPGLVEVGVARAPSNSQVAVLGAGNTNGFVKGGTTCSGAKLEIGEPFSLPPTLITVDSAGNGAATVQLPAGRCWMQALDLSDCETSSVVKVPPPPD